MDHLNAPKHLLNIYFADPPFSKSMPGKEAASAKSAPAAKPKAKPKKPRPSEGK